MSAVPSRPVAAVRSTQLLEFQSSLHRCGSVRDVLFAAVNEAYPFLQFDQAVAWRLDFRSRPRIGAVSGLTEVGDDSPYAQWIVRAIDYIRINRPGNSALIEYGELPEAIVEDGQEWIHEHLLHCPFRAPDGSELGGLLFHRSTPFTEQDKSLAEWIAGSVGYSVWAWREQHRRLSRMFRSRTVRYVLSGLLLVCAALAFIPVRQSAVAGAEVTPERPIPITSPTEGVVARIVVQPNQVVKADQVLVELDDTAIRNRLSVAHKALDIARADFQRATNKSFTEEASKSDLLVLDSRAREKETEVAYLSELLGRLKITSPQGGIAIFNDAEDWRGRPVQPGERIMTIADPSLVGVTVYLAPEDAVELSAGADVDLYLNINPLSSLHAKIVQTSYEATALPDNTLAYVIKAALQPDGEGLPRIGQRGTAKVYGARVPLGAFLLRKPILFVRKSFGV